MTSVDTSIRISSPTMAGRGRLAPHSLSVHFFSEAAVILTLESVMAYDRFLASTMAPPPILPQPRLRPAFNHRAFELVQDCLQAAKM